ncbi:unnamed protein product [Symbiodinium natans]|uniref:Uncharacterized protein n=1 Tax=Symbiodinium natans TaxID=878477 RepID=A0A812M5V5_9DINO|nr:unnamed protein product [Symbiodinium natans]
MELPAFEVEEEEAAGTNIDLGLPAFDAEDEDDIPVSNLVPKSAQVPVKTQPGAGVDLTGDHDEGGDVWQRLERELQAPIHLPVADSLEPTGPAGETADDKEDSDDDWAFVWKGSQSKLPSNILQEIENNVKAAADFHKENWTKKKEEDEQAQEDDDEEGWGAHMYESKEEKEASKENWVPEEDWSEWASNSKEAVAAQRLVQKIRSRVGSNVKQELSDQQPFPSEDLLEVIKLWIAREMPEQRMLLAMLLWIEAITIEVPIVRPDLNHYAMTILAKEENQTALREAADHVSHDVLLVKAGAPIPPPALRNEEAPKVQKSLISSLSGMLGHADFRIDEEDLTSMFEEVFADLPLTLRLASLVHLNEKAELLKKLWADKSSLLEEMRRLAAFDRASEVICRLTLQHAVQLGQQALNKDFRDLRDCLVDSLNRMGTEWRIAPNEEHLMQIHTLTLERQLQIMLSIERDIELQWYGLSLKVKSPDERSRQLRTYLNFEERLRPYLLEADLVGGKQLRDLQTESGMSVEIKDLAGVRQGVTEVFKKLKQRYQWKPTMTSRVEISRVNWVARLSAVIRLAMKTTCLFADQELRHLLREDEKRKLGREVFEQYKQWSKLERGDGMAIKGIKIAPADLVAKIRQKYEALGQAFQQPQFQPHTPAGLGVAAMTPGMGLMTPGLNPGTPGLGNLTPGGTGTRTPFNLEYSGGYEKVEGNTPQWKTPMTPLGQTSGMPSAGTPLFQTGVRASRTPGGPPPPTPTEVRASGTPGGPPPPTPGQVRASGTPGGPPPPTPGQAGAHVRGSMTPPGPAAFTPNLQGSYGINPFTPGGIPGQPATPVGQFGAPVPFTPGGPPPPTPGAPTTPAALSHPPRTPSYLPGSANAPTTPVALQKDEKSVKTESA